MKKLEQGISDFREFITEGCYFVDKSHLIAHLIDHPSKVHLITRPRRFGKTLNLSMIRYFFEAPPPGEEGTSPPNAALFDGLSITKHPRFKEFMGQYPVIHLSFKNVKGSSCSKSVNLIGDLLSDEFRRHSYLAEHDLLDKNEKVFFRKILGQEGTTENLAISIKNLSAWLERVHGKPAYILLDEYDTPLHAAYIGQYYDGMIEFIRSLMVQTFKDNPHLKQAVVIGILKVAQESLFSDFNNPAVSTIIDPEMEDCFGFTEDEVKKMLIHFSLEKEMGNIREWYNGYIFGNGTVIYNPWSIVNYLRKPSAGLRPYWSNTSDNELAKTVLQLHRESSRKAVEVLLRGQELRREVTINIAYPQLEDGDEDMVWGFLLHGGYLKASDMRQLDDGPEYKLEIPNREVRTIFKRIIRKWLNQDLQVNEAFLRFVQGIREMNAVFIEEGLSEVLYNLASFHDTTRGVRKDRKLGENFYHGLILGLLAYFGGEYTVESNREYGKGRADIVLVRKGSTPQNAEEALVFEFKQGNTVDSTPLETQAKIALDQEQVWFFIASQRGLERLAKTAWDQALEKYKAAVREKWQPKTMLVLGVGFRGKELALRCEGWTNGEPIRYTAYCGYWQTLMGSRGCGLRATSRP